MLRSLLISLIVSLSTSAVVAQAGDQQFQVYREAYPADGVELGRGWFQNMGSAGPGKCMVGAGAPLNVADVSYTFEEVLSREQVFKALRVNAAAKYGAFSASANFANTSETDRSQLSVLAVVNVRKGGSYFGPDGTGKPMGLEEARLKELTTAADLSKGDRAPLEAALRKFFNDCGDSYVAAIENGAQYSTKFTVATSKDTRNTLYGAAASGGWGRFKASMSFSSQASSLLTASETRISSFQVGGDLSLPLTAKDAYDRIENFAAKVPAGKDGIPTNIVLRPYESHPKFPAVYIGIRTPAARLENLGGLADRFSALSDQYRSAYFALNLYQYPFQAFELNSAVCGSADPGEPTKADDCIRKEISTSVATIDLISDCLSKVQAWCRRDLTCNLQRIPSNTEASQCLLAPEVEKLVSPKILTVKALAGSKAADTNEVKETSRLLVDRLVAIFKKPAPPATPADAGKPQFAVLDEEELARSYLYLLARLPLSKQPSGLGPELDEIAEVCKSFFPDEKAKSCLGTNVTTLSEAQQKIFRLAVREWLISGRLGRAVSGACAISASHPLCEALPLAMEVADGVKSKFDEAHRFTAAAVVTPPTTPAVALPPKPEVEKYKGTSLGQMKAGTGGRY